MKKIYVLALISGLFLTSNAAFAQQSLEGNSQSVYFEVLGNGVTYSFNYEIRFQNNPSSLGVRAGISYISIEGDGLLTLPVMLNYLLGNGGNYFEVGLGATYLSAEGNADVAGAEGGVIGTMTFGYRYQPPEGGFMFRVGFSPLFGEGFFIPYWPYLSFGYSF